MTSRSRSVVTGLGRLPTGAGLLAVMVGGCTVPEEPLPEEPLAEAPFDQPCELPQWTDDAAALGDPGRPTTLDLHGTQVRVVGEPSPEVERIDSARGIHLGDDLTAPLLVFEDATIDGEAAGTVVVSTKFVEANGGSFLGLGAAPTTIDDIVVRVDSPPGDVGGPRPTLGPDPDPLLEVALAQTTELTAVIEDFVIVDADVIYAATELESVPLALPLSISAPRAYWTHGSQIVANSAQLRYEGEVFIGLEPSSGEITIDGEAVPLPYAMLGRDAHIVAGPDHVSTVDAMPVRQALAAEGALVAADMELRICQSDPMVFDPGQVRVLSMAFREPTGLADAVFTELTVVDTDTELEWPARVQVDPEIPAAFVDAAEGCPTCNWADQLVEIFDAWAKLVGALADVFGCVITLGLFCGDHQPPPPPPLRPLPGWAAPGELGTFEVELAAPLEPGEHPVVFTIRGQNYETSATTTVVVRD